MNRALALLIALSPLPLVGCDSEGASNTADGDASTTDDGGARDAWWLNVDAGPDDVAPDPGPSQDAGATAVDAGPPPPPTCLDHMGCLQQACSGLPGDQLATCYAENTAACVAAEGALDEGEQSLTDAVTGCLAEHECGVDGSDIGLECAAAHCVAPWGECWSGKVEGEGNCLDIQACLVQCPKDPFGGDDLDCVRACAATGRASSLMLYLEVDWCQIRHCGDKEGVERENCESDVKRTVYCHLEWIDCSTDRFR